MENTIQTKFENLDIEISKLNLTLDDILIFKGPIPPERVEDILIAIRSLDIKQPILLLQPNQFLETMTVNDLQKLLTRYEANPEAEVH